MRTYRNRLVDKELKDRLNRVGAVLIEGPKACGKTLTAKQTATSVLQVDIDPEARLISTAPNIALDGPTPRLLDEWQVEPELWNLVRRAVDERQLPGQFILTGSAMPADDATRHSGAGRFSRLRMRPFSMLELGHSSGEVSLEHIAAGGALTPTPPSSMTLLEVVDALCVGGWPMNLEMSVPAAMKNVQEYLDEISRVDIATYEMGQKPRDPERIAAVIRSISRSVGSAIKAATIANDVNGDEAARGTSVTAGTVGSYIEAISKVMILERLPAWNTHLRSKATLRTSAKYYFADPSLAVAALRASPNSLITDLKLLGQLFENLVMRDLLAYAQHIDAEVSYYRDSNDLEVDAILDHADGTWQAIEIKLGTDGIDHGAESLKRLVANVDTSKKGAPRALSVITAVGASYTRNDGVHVVALQHLGV